MFPSIKNKYALLYIFKTATIIHLIGLIASFIIHSYDYADSMISRIIEYSLLGSLICISMIVAIKALELFVQRHQKLIKNHAFFGFIIELCIVGGVSAILFLNQEITTRVLIAIANLSKLAHSNTLYSIAILFILFLCVELYHAVEINKQSINSEQIQKTIYSHGISLALKLSIIIATTIGFMHPLIKMIQPGSIKNLDSLIFQFTTTHFFLYIHTIIVILLGVWIPIGIYYMYKFYKKRK